MKDTTPRGPEFRPQFSAGAVARMAESDAAAHGAEMDAPSVLPSGCWVNSATCQAYPWPFMGLAAR